MFCVGILELISWLVLFLASFLTFCRLCRCSVDSMGSDQDGVPSKVSDSGVGGLESGEDSWISDTEVH